MDIGAWGWCENLKPIVTNLKKLSPKNRASRGLKSIVGQVRFGYTDMAARLTPTVPLPGISPVWSLVVDHGTDVVAVLCTAFVMFKHRCTASDSVYCLGPPIEYGNTTSG